MVLAANGRLYPRGVDPRTRKKHTRRAKLLVVSLIIMLPLLCLPLVGWYMMGQTPAKYVAYRQKMNQSNLNELRQEVSDMQTAIIGNLLAPDADDKSGGEPNADESSPDASDASLVSMQVAGFTVKDLGKDKDGHALRQVELGPEQVNAWLAASFADWMEYRDFDLPAEIKSPMIDVANGATTLFFTYENEQFSQVVQASFTMKIDSEGMATLKLSNMLAGRLPLPVDSVGQLAGQVPGQSGGSSKASSWLAKMQNYRFKPALKLPDGLKAQIVDYQTQGEKVRMTLRIERYRPSTKPAGQAQVASAEAK